MHIIVRQTSLHIYVAFIVFSFFTYSIKLAQTPNGNLTQFTEQNNWHSSKLGPLFQDKFGCIWAGTNNALTLYEFNRFYSNPNNSASIKTVQSNLFAHTGSFSRTKSFQENLKKHNSIKKLFIQSNRYRLYDYHFIINQNLSL